MMNGYDMNGWGWTGMALMTVILIATVGLVVWSIARRPGNRPESGQSPREQLDARLASGAIDTDDYRKRLDALRRP